MKTKIYYLFIAIMALLMCSCVNVQNRNLKDSTIEYDVIEIDNCEYIMVISKTYGIGLSVTSIAHKGNCKYCEERRNKQ